MLVNLIAKPVYDNFLSLSVAMSILLNPDMARTQVGYVQKLLEQFFFSYKEVYGIDMMVYNVHNVLHLTDDARKYGNLDNVSAFPFENFLGQLKKKVRCPSNPLPQIIRRTHESLSRTKTSKPFHMEKSSRKLHSSGPLPDNINFCKNQFKKYCCDTFEVSCSPGDNCFLFGRDNVILVQNIIMLNDIVQVVYESFEVRQSFFRKPLDSRVLGIFVVSSLSSSLSIIPVSELSRKCYLLPFPSSAAGDAYVSIPLVHQGS